MLVNLTGTGASFAGNAISMFRFDATGGSNLTSGTYTVNGVDVMISPIVPAGVTATFNGLVFSSTPQIAGTISAATGAAGNLALSAGTGTCTTAIAVKAGINTGSVVTTTAIGFQATNIAGVSITAAVTQATAYDVGPTFMNDADVVTWSGFRCSTGLTAAIANKWCLDLTNTATNMGSRIAHPVAAGWNPSTVSAITARLMLAIGTTAASTAPLKFQSGTNMTTAEAGAVEFTTDDLFFTITTGAARKAFILDDGTRLTATRVPFATTNGRLIDDADMTFATDTLTVTKIVASTNLTVAGGAAITELERTKSGVYTPTLTNVANLDASTAFQCQYMRVGATVTVSGKVAVDPTLTATTTQLGISLPIASNIGAEEDCCGTAAAKAIAGQSAGILGDATNDRAQMEWKAGDITNQSMYFSFTYRII